jgi:hypothetical protein
MGDFSFGPRHTFSVPRMRPQPHGARNQRDPRGATPRPGDPGRKRPRCCSQRWRGPGQRPKGAPAPPGRARVRQAGRASSGT